jgi:hypothetical protein
MNATQKGLVVLGLCVLAVPVVLLRKAHGSDHADTPELASNPGQDISDVFMFPDPNDTSKVVLVMNVNPLITPAKVGSTFLDPNVLYQFKLDTTGRGVEDKVIQVKATGSDANQTISVAGPVKPSVLGTTANLETAYGTTGKFNTAFSPTTGMTVFVGVREDPFFFDLEQFFNIFPDRATPITGKPVAQPDKPLQTSFRPVGTAKDFLSAGGYNVISIVVELPRTMLVGG